MKVNKQLLSIILLISYLLISCSSLKTDKQIIKEGYGIEKFISVTYDKQTIDSLFNKSNLCKTIEGTFIKNTDCEYIDNRKYILKKADNQRCFDDLNISVFFDKNDIIEITFYSKKYVTQKGVEIGDKNEKVYRLYGDNYRQSFYPIPSNKTKNISFKDFGLEIDYFDDIGIGFVYDNKGEVTKILVFNISEKE